jgi:hypothetical protein
VVFKAFFYFPDNPFSLFPAKSPNAEGEFFQSGKAFPAFCLEKIQPEKAVIVFFCLDPVEMVKIDNGSAFGIFYIHDSPPIGGEVGAVLP